ncbi:related to ribosomal protein S4 precursor, mitochondrial [Ustilago trichophora]|uniref:Related to ribosomal protein S4, mitochondrial n=1 Tax=Ustilago trichophora TaxID=86804 RepID=A0A5C3E3H0_9BASI|nr:related to ribosomal protein S4 precursor, mitochondrial [Ustilago trichophora]
MRKAKVFSHETIMPRMSWSSRNLYNMIARSTVPFHASQTTFTKTSLTMYQQRWRSKRFLRAYHGDWIPEKRFKRWFLPTELPSFVPPQVSASSGSSSASNAGPRKGGLFDKALQARRAPTGPAAEVGSRHAAVTQQKVIEEMDPMPTASLFMRDVERRLDVVVFRSCFARSAYESRGMVVQGKVKVNGVKCNNPNQLLQPGDLVSVEPSAVPMLSKQLADKAKSQKVNDAVTGEAEATEAAQAAEAEAEAAPVEAEAKEGESAAAATESTTSSSEAAASDSTDSTRATTSPTSSKGKEKEKTLPPGVHPFTLPDYAAPFLFIPPYLEVSFTTCSVIYVRHPTIVPYKTFSPADNKARWTFRTDLPSPYPAGGELYSMAWEHYTRNAPRTRADARRTKLEAKVGRNGFESQRAKDQNMKRSALRRGWGRTKQVSGWRGQLAAAQTQAAKQGKKSNNKKEARVVA